MKVKFKNTKKLTVTQLFVDNALRYLGIDDLEDTKIVVAFVDELDNGESHGHCSGDEQRVDITIATNFPFLMQLRTLSHELIHARQFFSGELDSNLTVWKGMDYSHADYESQPWELEAHKYEDQLFMEAFPWNVNV